MEIAAFALNIAVSALDIVRHLLEILSVGAVA